MMTIGEVIELLKTIFEILSKYLGEFFGGEEDAEGTEETTEATE